MALLAGPALRGQSPVPSARIVPAHQVPVPGTVSLEFARKIAQPDTIWPHPLPTTNAGWAKLGSADAQATNAKIDLLLKQLDLTLTEQHFGGVATFEILPRVIEPANRKRLLLNIHGGAYVLGAGRSGTLEAVLVAGTSRMKTIAIDYRTPPDFPFPAPMDDAVHAWRAITRAFAGYRIGLFGTSAGGAMVLSLVQRAKAENLRLPLAVISGTPWSDLSETGDSYFTNKYLDPMRYDAVLQTAAAQYAAGLDLKNPRLSPVYGDFSGFPPTLLLSGTRDLFLSNTVRIDRKLRDAGAQSELIVYEGASHARYLAGLEYPETRTALEDIARLWRKHL